VRILLDAREVFHPQPRGTGKNLVDLYCTLAAIKPDWEFVLAHEAPIQVPALSAHPNIRPLRAELNIPGVWRINGWQEFVLPLLARREAADVIHCPANVAPWIRLPRYVLTLHDLIPLEIAPQARETLAWVRRVRRSVWRAAHVITPSDYSKGRIANIIGRTSEVTTIPWAADRKVHRVHDEAALAAIRAKYAGEGTRRFVLGFGASDPRKNTENIIRAFAELDSSIRSEVHLVIVGIQSAARARFVELAAALGISDCTQLHGFADESDISGLLSAADVLCYVSQSEGFGLPILDAFACGTPVITSDRSSLPEVIGEAGMRVDPFSTQAITAALRKMLSSVPMREQFSALGAKRGQLYTWERCARSYVEVFIAASHDGAKAPH
jgi:glycosyltransferase involved in cell wall biosynthesis